MKRGAILLAALGLLISACDRRPPPALRLPVASDATYVLFLRTYEDGYGDQPFELSSSPIFGPDARFRLLSAEQCRNVTVAQTPAVLYVFFDELMMTGGVSSFPYDGRPRPVLCDLASPYCRQMRDDLVRTGVRLQPICTLQSAYARPKEIGPAGASTGP